MPYPYNERQQALNAVKDINSTLESNEEKIANLEQFINEEEQILRDHRIELGGGGLPSQVQRSAQQMIRSLQQANNPPFYLQPVNLLEAFDNAENTPPPNNMAFAHAAAVSGTFFAQPAPIEIDLGILSPELLASSNTQTNNLMNSAGLIDMFSVEFITNPIGLYNNDQIITWFNSNDGIRTWVQTRGSHPITRTAITANDFLVNPSYTLNYYQSVAVFFDEQLTNNNILPDQITNTRTAIDNLENNIQTLAQNHHIAIPRIQRQESTSQSEGTNTYTKLG